MRVETVCCCGLKLIGHWHALQDCLYSKPGMPFGPHDCARGMHDHSPISMALPTKTNSLYHLSGFVHGIGDLDPSPSPVCIQNSAAARVFQLKFSFKIEQLARADSKKKAALGRPSFATYCPFRVVSASRTASGAVLCESRLSCVRLLVHHASQDQPPTAQASVPRRTQSVHV